MNAIERDDKIPERESQPAVARLGTGIAGEEPPARFGLRPTGLMTVTSMQPASGCEMIDRRYVIN